MITQNLSTLKIHKLTQAQYERELEAGRIDENAIYLTPDEGADLSIYALKEDIPDISNKVDKVEGKGLSTNDYTTTEKNKLAGIAAGAEVNVQPDWSQNDETAPDYIKNRTHYVYSDIALEEYVNGTTWYYDGYRGYSFNSNTNLHKKAQEIHENGNYSLLQVKVNDVLKNIIGTESEIANDGFRLNFDDGTSLYIEPGYGCYEAEYTEDSLPITINAIVPIEKIQQLDEKFIPDTIARTSSIPEQVQPDWNQNDVNSPSYIKNRTHYSEIKSQLFQSSCLNSYVTFAGSRDCYECKLYFEDLSSENKWVSWFNNYEDIYFCVGDIYRSKIINAERFADDSNYIYCLTLEDTSFIRITTRFNTGSAQTIEHEITPALLSALQQTSNAAFLKRDQGNVEIIHPIDKKYLSPVADWDEQDSNNPGFIQNKTHYRSLKDEKIFSFYSEDYDSYHGFWQYNAETEFSTEDFLRFEQNYKNIQAQFSTQLKRASCTNVSISYDQYNGDTCILTFDNGKSVELPGYSFYTNRYPGVWPFAYDEEPVSHGEPLQVDLYITEDSYIPLDEKYIPETIARKDWVTEEIEDSSTTLLQIVESTNEDVSDILTELNELSSIKALAKDLEPIDLLAKLNIQGQSVQHYPLTDLEFITLLQNKIQNYTQTELFDLFDYFYNKYNNLKIMPVFKIAPDNWSSLSKYTRLCSTIRVELDSIKPENGSVVDPEFDLKYYIDLSDNAVLKINFNYMIHAFEDGTTPEIPWGNLNSSNGIMTITFELLSKSSGTVSSEQIATYAQEQIITPALTEEVY